jgi:hypothetical protein
MAWVPRGERAAGAFLVSEMVFDASGELLHLVSELDHLVV